MTQRNIYNVEQPVVEELHETAHFEPMSITVKAASTQGSPVADLSLSPAIHAPADSSKPGRATKRQSDKTALSAKATKRQKSDSSAVFEQLSTLIRGRKTAQIGTLPVEQIRGRAAFEQLASLVRDWRVESRLSPPLSEGGLELVNHVLGETFVADSGLHIFLRRLSKVLLVNFDLEVSRGNIDELLIHLSWAEAERNRLHDYLREGKCWKTICGSYDGLLSLLPTSIPDAQIAESALFHNTVTQFHAEINVPIVHRMCEVGRILQRAIWGGLELPEFIWEATVDETAAADMKQLYDMLGRFQLARTNHFDPVLWQGWPAPAGWEWGSWPANPTTISPYDDTSCVLCHQPSHVAVPCLCFYTHVPSVPRISDDGSKGPGIRAVGQYKAGDFLGELVGQIVPIGTCGREWTVEFRRPDLDNEPVAEIYTKVMGNWVRKVRHAAAAAADGTDAGPSTELKVVKISGLWRMMLVARREIRDGEEICATGGRGRFSSRSGAEYDPSC